MALLEIEGFLKRAIGLDAHSLGGSTLERAVLRRMASCGLQRVEDYLGRLQGSDREELEELTEALVVPETWFFRDTQAFVALKQLALDSWQPAHPQAGLRLLSVPCSTGEEPYSMAMALLDAGLPPDRFEIDAMDISRRALIRAQRAVYGANSFRSADLGFRELYFQPAANSPDLYVLGATTRTRIHFAHRNLLDADLWPESECYDFIFCRNVLIYFDRPTQQKVLQTMERLLKPDGVLFLGSAETYLAMDFGMKPVDHPMAFACRKSAAGSRQPRALRPPREATPVPPARPKKLPLRSTRKPPPRDATRAQPLTQVPVASAQASDLETGMRLANGGRLTEAAEAFGAHLRQHGDSSQAHYLLGLVRDALGQQREANESYRKALYLEPDHTEALIHLALLAEKQGNLADARRLRERARRAEQRAGR